MGAQILMFQVNVVSVFKGEDVKEEICGHLTIEDKDIALPAILGPSE